MVLSTDLDRDDAIPYFLWDDPMTVAELRHRLRTASEPERVRLLGKILREARDPDVWRFTTPEEVWAQWNALSRHLGRRRAFWEYLLARWREEPQSDTAKERSATAMPDSAEEILANKLCTILARAEVRDLVDVFFLERAGRPAEQGLPLAARKDGGVSAAQLAWILSSVQIGDDARIPAGVSAVDLRRFIKDLESRFTALARPGERRP